MGWKSQNRAGRRLIDFVNTFRPAKNLSFPFAALKKGRGPARSNDNANIWIGLRMQQRGFSNVLSRWKLSNCSHQRKRTISCPCHMTVNKIAVAFFGSRLRALQSSTLLINTKSSHCEKRENRLSNHCRGVVDVTIMMLPSLQSRSCTSVSGGYRCNLTRSDMILSTNRLERAQQVYQPILNTFSLAPERRQLQVATYCFPGDFRRQSHAGDNRGRALCLITN